MNVHLKKVIFNTVHTDTENEGESEGGGGDGDSGVSDFLSREEKEMEKSDELCFCSYFGNTTT